MTRWTAFDFQMATDSVMDTWVSMLSPTLAILHCEGCDKHWVVELFRDMHPDQLLDVRLHCMEKRAKGCER